MFVGLVPMLVVLERGTPGPRDEATARRSVRWSPLLLGFVFYAVSFWWIVRLPVSAMTHPWLIYPGLAALGLFLGLYTALFGWLTRFVRQRLGWPVLLTAPFAWTVAEWLKSSGELGLPWANLGAALARQPAWIQGASIVGTSGLSFWIVAVNALIAAAVLARRGSSRVGWAALAAALVVAPVWWGTERLSAAAVKPLVRVAIAQPNVGSHEKWIPALQDSVAGRVERLTRDAAALPEKPVIIIWPETALPYYVRHEPHRLRRLIALARQAGRPILAGYPDARVDSQGRVLTHNAAGLVSPTGAIVRQYDKVHLVPFGERIPFQTLFPFLGSLDLGQAEWTPGTRSVVFHGAGPAFGVLICFESIFPDLARRYATEGAQYLINITNDEWFGRTAGPVQHADLAILRCVELGMGLARAANTGISMLVDPYGRVGASTGLFEEALLVGDVMAGIGPTTYTRLGDWLSLLALGIMIALVAVAWFRPIGAHGEDAEPTLHRR